MKILAVISEARDGLAREVVGVHDEIRRTFHVKKIGGEWYFCKEVMWFFDNEKQRWERRLVTERI